MYLLDTNTLIYFFKREGQVEQRLRNTPIHLIRVPAITWFELEHGTLRSTKPEHQRISIDIALQAYGTAPLDYPSAKSAAAIKRNLEVAGTPIGHYDLLIAGIAQANNLTLVTRNTREFERVPGLRVENWYD
ncbi:MAG: type II toxin-antitoxin system VapC family toxin [Polaromonas sp.]|nr:type II toxin-antitoxin system VapC family toxin [Polaromonas sp.]